MTRSARLSRGGQPAPPAIGAAASVIPAHEHWVSSAAVRQAIGAWAYSLGAAESRPSNEDVRAAVGVASAIREVATDSERRRWDQASDGAGDVSVPEDLSELAARSGLAAREVERALELLASARVVTRQIGASVATVALVADTLAPAPAVARIDWSAVRERLHAVRGSVAPALSVLRELAALVGAFDAQGSSPSVRASVRDLESATSYGRSTVSEALSALDSARLVDVETRAGRTTRFAIRPSVFGLPDEAPPIGAVLASVMKAAERRVASESRRVAGTSSEPSRSMTLANPSVTPAVGLSSVALIGTFAGTPIFAPQGTPLVLDRDAEGRWLCRVGPLVLGPIESQ